MDADTKKKKALIKAIKSGDHDAFKKALDDNDGDINVSFLIVTPPVIGVIKHLSSIDVLHSCKTPEVINDALDAGLYVSIRYFNSYQKNITTDPTVTSLFKRIIEHPKTKICPDLLRQLGTKIATGTKYPPEVMPTLEYLIAENALKIAQKNIKRFEEVLSEARNQSIIAKKKCKTALQKGDLPEAFAARKCANLDVVRKAPGNRCKTHRLKL